MALMLVLIIFTYAIWGGSAVSTKVALTTASPLFLSGLRMGIMLLVLAVWIVAKGISVKPEKEELAVLLLNGLLSTLVMALFNEGLSLTTASRGTVFMHTYPFFVAGLAQFLLVGDRLSRQKFIGLVVAFVGVVALFVGKGGASSGSLAGDLMVILSALVLANQFVWQKKLVRRMNPAKLLFWSGLVSLPIFFSSGLFLEEGWIGPPSAAAVLAILYLGLVIGGYCFLFQITMLKYLSPNLLASFSFLVPVTGVIYSILLLREPLTQGLVIGAVLVAVGIFVVNYRSKAGLW